MNKDTEVADFYKEQYEAFYECFNENEYHASGRGSCTDEKDIEAIIHDLSRKILFEKSDVVLDLGAGSGLVALGIQDKVSRICTFDGSASAIEILKKKLPHWDDDQFAVGNLTQPLPYKDSYFDKIISYSVFHYLDGLDSIISAIDECIRVTKPGGKIYLADLPMKMPFLKESYHLYFIKGILTNILKGSKKPILRSTLNYCEYAFKSHRNLKSKWIRRFLNLPFTLVYKLLIRHFVSSYDTSEKKEMVQSKKRFKEKVPEYNKFGYLYFDEIIPKIKEHYKGNNVEIHFQSTELVYSFDRLDLALEVSKAAKS